MSLRRCLHRLRIWFLRSIGALFLIMLLGGGAVQNRSPADRVRRYTRQEEFNFAAWTIDALLIKLEQLGLGVTGYLAKSDRLTLVRDYYSLLQESLDLENQLAETVADPGLSYSEASVSQIVLERDAVRSRMAKLQPIMEALLQEQVAFVLSDLSLEFGGAPFPPVMFHVTRPPTALIISPRDVIRQDANISLDPELELEEYIALEEQVEQAMGVSALVVRVGGMGVYPTMIQESTSLSWVVEVIVHEWIHNYLTLRPLGWNYNTSSELRTMNETTANILGKVISRRVLERYYPDLVPPLVDPSAPSPPPPGESLAFDFRAEMHQTRVTVDELLSQGRIQDAEAYMEAQRQVFWENGYRIRRLNQAYFAFHGAYADQPEGAAGEDPVGAAVRELWARIASPAEFLRIMAGMNNFTDLQAEIGKHPGD